MSSFGVALPLSYDSADGFRMLKRIKEVIKQNFKMLVLTNPGERVMEPEFGVGLKQYLFENFGQGTFQAIDTNIRSQTAKYMPVIAIREINFGQSTTNENLLALSISYSIPAISDSDLIEFTI
jgi:phage baseplate assembly protein W